jgi:hypothetical protein
MSSSNNDFAHSKTHYAQRKHPGTLSSAPAAVAVDAGFGEHVTMRAGLMANVRDLHPERATSIVVGEAGRVHFPPTYSDYVEERQHKKMPWHLEHSAEYVERGKRYLVGKVPDDDQAQGKRHLTPNPSEVVLFHHKWDRKTRASCNESYLYDMEGYMNRKKRVPTLEEQRNFVPMAASGDKYYKDADREPGFFKNKGAKPAFKKTDDSRKPPPLRATMSYAEKTRRKELEDDMNDIRTLDNTSEKLKQVVPSWEERTGAYLVRPEDEKY